MPRPGLIRSLPERIEGSRLVAPGVLVLVCLLLGARSLTLGFNSDDHALLFALEQGHGLMDRFPAGLGSYYRPLMMESLRAGELIRAGDPTVHHAVNLAIHVANALLVYAIARVLRAPRLVALGAGLLFASHPANVTDVYWISGRTDLLCTLGYLSALAAAAHFVLGGGAAWLALSVLGTAISLGAKE